jgi:hypothetical protein
MLALTAPTTASAATTAQLQRQIAVLKKQNAALTQKTRTQTATITKLNTTITTLTTARDNALKGLPAAILAVPREQFRTMVFGPAIEAWTCNDSVYESEAYWSYTYSGGSGC